MYVQEEYTGKFRMQIFFSDWIDVIDKCFFMLNFMCFIVTFFQMKLDAWNVWK